MPCRYHLQASQPRTFLARKLRDFARIFGSTVAYLPASVESAFISNAPSVAIEVFCTVSPGSRPFTDDSPLVEATKRPAVSACGIEMVWLAHGNKAGSKHLIVVGIDDNVVPAIHEAVPGLERLEGIRKGDGDKVRTRLASNAPSVYVELANLIHIEVGSEGYQ